MPTFVGTEWNMESVDRRSAVHAPRRRSEDRRFPRPKWWRRRESNPRPKPSTTTSTCVSGLWREPPPGGTLPCFGPAAHQPANRATEPIPEPHRRFGRTTGNGGHWPSEMPSGSQTRKAPRGWPHSRSPSRCRDGSEAYCHRAGPPEIRRSSSRAPIPAQAPGDRRAARPLRAPQLVELLEVEPELPRGAEEAAQAECRFAGDGALAVENPADVVRRDFDAPRQSAAPIPSASSSSRSVSPGWMGSRMTGLRLTGGPRPPRVRRSGTASDAGSGNRRSGHGPGGRFCRQLPEIRAPERAFHAKHHPVPLSAEHGGFRAGVGQELPDLREGSEDAAKQSRNGGEAGCPPAPSHHATAPPEWGALAMSGGRIWSVCGRPRPRAFRSGAERRTGDPRWRPERSASG